MRDLIVVAICASALGACQDSRARLSAPSVAPTGIPIAFDSIEGAPPDLRSAFAADLADAAQARQVELAGAAGPARYRLKGYLTTETSDDGATSLAFVWDVFDAEKRRAKRVAGSSPLGGPLDREAMRKLAAKSMDEIVVFLASRDGGTSLEETGLRATGRPAPG